MKKFYSLVGIAAAAALVVACGGDDTVDPIGPGDGDGDTAGTGGTTPGGTGGTTPGGTGGTTPGGTGGSSGGGMTPSTFATDGLGINGDWNGFLFTVPDEVGGTITPASFTGAGANLCATGTTGASYEGFGIIGWNVNQPQDETGAAISDVGDLVTPGGSGVNVVVQNNTPGTTLRVQLQDNSMNRWCAEVPAAGGVIPWTEFAKECWPGGTPVPFAMEQISQVQVQAVAGADPLDPSGATGGATPFDFCVITLGQAP